MAIKENTTARLDSERVYLKAGGADAGTVWIKNKDGRLRTAEPEEATLACDTIPKFRATRQSALRIAK